MAHPKRKISQRRRDARRTHHKLKLPQLAQCPVTKVWHPQHRAYEKDGSIYYQGRLYKVLKQD